MIKKITFLIIFTLMLLLSTTVFADMDSPMIDTYTAIISNKNGAIYYIMSNHYTHEELTEVGKLNYNDEISVQMEYSINGIDYIETYINENYYFIKANDIKAKDEYQDEKDHSIKFIAKVITEDGVEMYAGPSLGYEKINQTIPYDTEITGYGTKYNTDEPWIYVEYKGNKGWINILDSKVVIKEQDTYFSSLYTYKACDIYKGDKIISSIPANTEIKDFFSSDAWSREYYITYNGVSGIVSAYEIGIKPKTFTRYYTDEDEIILYEKGERNAKLTYYGPLTEEERESLIVIYEEYDIRGSGWYYIMCNDKSGWIFVEEDYETENGIKYNYTAKSKNGKNVTYYTLDEDENFIPAGTITDNEFELNYETALYDQIYAQYSVDDNYYYVKTTDIENINLNNANLPKEFTEPAKIVEKTEEVSDSNISEDTISQINNPSSIPVPQVVTICIGVAIVVFFTTLVTISLINKNKDSKDNKENKE